MKDRIVPAGESRSFPETHSLLDGALDKGDVLILIGEKAGEAYASAADKASYKAILIELGTECLGVHTDEGRGQEGSNVLGFARFRLGDSAPSNLVEIVRQHRTSSEAIAAAREIFESSGLTPSACGDFPGTRDER